MCIVSPKVTSYTHFGAYSFFCRLDLSLLFPRACLAFEARWSADDPISDSLERLNGFYGQKTGLRLYQGTLNVELSSRSGMRSRDSRMHADTHESNTPS
jgi:hypothetical protein